MDGDSTLLWNLGCTMVWGDVVPLKPRDFNANKRCEIVSGSKAFR